MVEAGGAGHGGGRMNATGGGRSLPPLLPGQRADQYLTEANEGVEALALSMLKQIGERGERLPDCF